jgi:hypothetical protein
VCGAHACINYVRINCHEVEVKVNLRPTVSRPACPGVRRPSGTCDQFFFHHEISCRQLRLCYCVAPSLMRGRVCNLLYNCFWALPEQSLLSRNPAKLAAIFYCLIWDPPNLEGQVLVFISPRNRVAQLYPRALGLIAMLRCAYVLHKHRDMYIYIYIYIYICIYTHIHACVCKHVWNAKGLLQLRPFSPRRFGFTH